MSEMGPQESGVTHTRGVHFGPALQEHYDASKWSLTTQSSTHEIILDPEPADRRRVNGEPPFLRPSLAGPYVAPFLTIAHAIPLAREALLCRANTLRNYGHDDAWWNGAADIRVPTVVRLADTVFGHQYDDIIHETQRLMAFLDQTDRSYGTVDSLVKMDLVRDDDPTSVLPKYIDNWREAVRRRSESGSLGSIFESVGVKKLEPSGEVLGRQNFRVLELQLDRGGDASSPQTLYEAMDALIWEGPAANEESVAYLETVGDVFTVRLTNPGLPNPTTAGAAGPAPVGAASSGIGADIPLRWYPDRYLERCLPMAKQMRAQQTAVRREIDHLGTLQSRLTKFAPSAGGPAVDPRVFVRIAGQFFEKAAMSPQSPTPVPVPLGGMHAAAEDRQPLPSERCAAMVEKLRTILENVSAKVNGVALFPSLPRSLSFPCFLPLIFFSFAKPRPSASLHSQERKKTKS